MKLLTWFVLTAIALLAFLALTGCTTVYYPNGKKSVSSSADFQSLASRADGSVTIVGHRPSANQRAAGSVIGTTLTSGALLARPLP